MSGIDFARRTALAVLACMLVTPQAAVAQDPRATVVQKVARDWLALADALDGNATWNAAGPRFQQAISAAKWNEALRRQRGPRGETVQRTIVATSFGSSFRGLPEGGSYAMVRFRTSFANETSGGDDVTLELGPDNVWRVIGYVIR
jgi:Protein of unknown function (DUF4019)